jgi:hypothetical protein
MQYALMPADIEGLSLADIAEKGFCVITMNRNCLLLRACLLYLLLQL